MTAYGHASLDLATHWQVMGALEALNGMLLFGLTTAALFSIIQRVWDLRGSGSRLTSRTAAFVKGTECGNNNPLEPPQLLNGFATST